MYFSEALSSTSNELQQVSSGRSLNELQARSARSKRKEIEPEPDESLLCASRRGLSSDLPGAPLTKIMGNQTLAGSCLSYESLLDSVIRLYKFSGVASPRIGWRTRMGAPSRGSCTPKRHFVNLRVNVPPKEVCLINVYSCARRLATRPLAVGGQARDYGATDSASRVLRQ